MRLWLRILAGMVLIMSTVALPAQEDDSEGLSNRLGHHANMVDRVVFFDTPAAWERGEFKRVAIENDATPKLILADGRSRGFPKSGSYETEEYRTEFPFTELIPSWNPDAPENTGFAFSVRARDEASQEWSPWLYIGQWGRTLHWPARTLEYEHGDVHVDNLLLKDPADAFQLRASFYSFDLDHMSTPTLRRMTAAYSGRIDDDAMRAKLVRPVILKGTWAQSLNVPFLAQGKLDRSVSGSTCSPTSTSMLLGFNGVNHALIENAMRIYDPEYGIFGNWARATALAGQYGLDAYVCRMRNWDQVKQKIEEGQPVIASIRFMEGEFPSNVISSSGGHLIVVRGFNEDGDPIVNDPASIERGEGVVYKADELARAWFDKGGVAYIIGKQQNGM